MKNVGEILQVQAGESVPRGGGYVKGTSVTKYEWYLRIYELRIYLFKPIILIREFVFRIFVSFFVIRNPLWDNNPEDKSFNGLKNCAEEVLPEENEEEQDDEAVPLEPFD